MPWYLVECYRTDGARDDQLIEAASSDNARSALSNRGLVVGNPVLSPAPAIVVARRKSEVGGPISIAAATLLLILVVADGLLEIRSIERSIDKAQREAAAERQSILQFRAVDNAAYDLETKLFPDPFK